MKATKRIGVAAALVGAIVLTGCTSGTHVPIAQIDQPTAKAQGLNIGKEAVGEIPARAVKSVATSPTGTWTHCDQPSQNLLGNGTVDYDHVFAWTGTIRVTPQTGEEPGELIRALKRAYEQKHPTWTTMLSTAGGDAFLQSYAPTQQGIDVSARDGLILIDSQSECFDAKTVLSGSY